MHIKILGPGCARCQLLEKTTREALKELAIDASIEHVKDISKIIEYPILHTPGLVINEKLVCSGFVPSKAEVSKLIIGVLAKDRKNE